MIRSKSFGLFISRLINFPSFGAHSLWTFIHVFLLRLVLIFAELSDNLKMSPTDNNWNHSSNYFFIFQIPNLSWKFFMKDIKTNNEIPKSLFGTGFLHQCYWKTQGYYGLIALLNRVATKSKRNQVYNSWTKNQSW